MADSKTLEEKLAASEAFRTLRAEREVVDALTRHGWDARHSPFYRDGVTGKFRELDATARRIWHSVERKPPITARVHLFVEVKSAREFHILCASAAASSRRFQANEYWLGYCEDTLAQLAGAAAEFGLKPSQVKDFIHGVEKICFPKHTMRVAPFRIDAMPAVNSYSAFRETNIGAEKDLENSVLWRALTGVRSAITRSKSEMVEGIVGDARVDMEVARRNRKGPLAYTGVIESRASAIDLYVPIVVIESRLWSAERESPAELPWFRLVENTLYGGSENWADVVNNRHLDSYLAALSEYFGGTFSELGAAEMSLGA